MDNTSNKFLLLMAVLVPYLILVGYSISIYPDLPDELSNDLPRFFVLLPSFAALMLPATYGVMVFFFSHYMKRAHFLTMAAVMDIGILGLMGAVYLIKDAA